MLKEIEILIRNITVNGGLFHKLSYKANIPTLNERNVFIKKSNKNKVTIRFIISACQGERRTCELLNSTWSYEY